MNELTILRQKIDQTDDLLVQLFRDRMEAVKAVAMYKQKNGMAVLDRGREQALLGRHLEKCESQTEKETLKAFLEGLMALSRNAQQSILTDSFQSPPGSLAGRRAGYQGVPGAFSHQAALACFGEEAQLSHYPSFESVFEAIAQEEVPFGILPVENSSTGSITEVYDLLGKYPFYIVGEKCIQVTHHLLGLPGAEEGQIREVYSHAQGFLQSSRYFAGHPHWQQVDYHNTAKSAEWVSQCQDPTKACVASAVAARLYGLSIIREAINNQGRNYTRFVVVAKSQMASQDCNKLSLVLSLPHQAGALLSVLAPVAALGVNLLKIETRPIESHPWEYLFYIDLTGNLQREDHRQMLDTMAEASITFRLLGNYVADGGGRV